MLKEGVSDSFNGCESVECSSSYSRADWGLGVMIQINFVKSVVSFSLALGPGLVVSYKICQCPSYIWSGYDASFKHCQQAAVG